MTKPTFEKARENRKQRNLDLIRRMRSGDNLFSFDSTSSWFPPRPIIEKDASAIKQLYGSTVRVRAPKKRDAQDGAQSPSLRALPDSHGSKRRSSIDPLGEAG